MTSQTSKITLDTNVLRIRELYAVNKETGESIPQFSIPVTGESGEVFWFSTIQYLSTISIPPTNITLETLLNQIQPGLSSLSTQNGSLFSTTFSTLTRNYSNAINVSPPNFSTPMYSTVAGLGTLGYLSTIIIELDNITATNLLLRENTFSNVYVQLPKVNTVAYQGNWFAGGQDGCDSAPLITTTDPGSRWYPVETNFTKINTLLPFTHNSQNILAAGGTTHTSSGTVQLNQGGVTWRSLQTNLTEVYGLAYGEAVDTNTYLIAVGTKDGVTGAVQKTTDFSTFTDEITPLTLGRDVVYDATSKTFTIVGYSDGSIQGNIVNGYPGNWTSLTTPFNETYAVTTNTNSFYLALGMNALTSTIYTASNSSGTWQLGEELFVPSSEYHLRYVSSTYVACGPNSTLFNPTGGSGLWSSVTNFFTVSKDIAYNGDIFVLVGSNPSTASTYFSTIAYSSTLTNFINTQFTGVQSTLIETNGDTIQVGNTPLTTDPIFISTTAGLGTAGYLSTTMSEYIFSTISTSLLYTRSTFVLNSQNGFGVNSNLFFTQPDLTSTVEGLGTLGYISGITFSTVSGLVIPGYCNADPTFYELFVSDLRLKSGTSLTHFTTSSSTIFINNTLVAFTSTVTSTIDGLGNIYTNSPSYQTDLVSSVAGLGNLYISSSQMISSITGMTTQSLIDVNEVASSINGLGSAGYFSTLVFEKALYESTFPSASTSILTTLDTANFILSDSDFDQWVGFINLKAIPGIGLTNTKVKFDFYINLKLKFDPLLADTPFQFTLQYPGANVIEYILPTGLSEFTLSKLSFVVPYNSGPIGSIFLNFSNNTAVPGVLSLSIPQENGIFVTVNNMD